MNHDNKKLEKCLILKLNLALQLLPSSDCSLLVDGFHHRERVAGQHVVHLVPQRRLTQQLRAAYQVADGHVEVRVPARPVGDLVEGVRHQDLLGLPVDQAHSLLADGDEKQLGVVLVGALLHLKEGAAKGGQLEDLLQELDLGVLRADARVLVVRLVNLLPPVRQLEEGELVAGDQLLQKPLLDSHP